MSTGPDDAIIAGILGQQGTPSENVVKGLTMLLKATAEYEQPQKSSELAEAMRAGLNPTPASAHRVSGGTAEQNPRHHPTGATRDTDLTR